MSVEADIYSTLQGLVGGRVFPDVAPFSTQRPYITYQQVGGVAPSFVDSTVPSKRNGRFQVNVWADTRAQASTIAAQIEAALIAATAFQARPLSAAVSLHDDATELRGCMQDFTVWSDR